LPYYFERNGLDIENFNPNNDRLLIGTGLGKRTKLFSCFCGGGKKNLILVCPTQALAKSAYDYHNSP